MSPKAKNLVANVLTSSVVSAAVGAIFSAYVASYIGDSFSRRLENSKNQFSTLNAQKSSFDNALNGIYAELGLFTGSVMDGKKNLDKTKVNQAITQTQLQLGELEQSLKKGERENIIEYARTLQVLKKSVDDVKTPDDLEEVYSAARKMLILHDKIDKDVIKGLKLSALSRASLPVAFPLA